MGAGASRGKQQVGTEAGSLVQPENPDIGERRPSFLGALFVPLSSGGFAEELRFESLDDIFKY